MRLVPIFAILFPWLLFEPLAHDMRFERAVIGIVTAVLAMVIGLLSVGKPRLRIGLSVLGALLVLSNFAFPDRMSVMASHFLAGAFLLVLGVTRRPVSTVTNESKPVTSTERALREEPQPGA
ncbi:MAG TPA: hypothetical protein VGG33_05920 [Polyangia bacterium]